MYPFRFLGVGLFAVGLILFAPFFFRFLLFAIILSAAFKLMRRFRGPSYACSGHYYKHERHPRFGRRYRDRYDDEGIVPSDY